MKKITLLPIIVFFSSISGLSAQLNTSDLNAYVSESNFGADVLETARDAFSKQLHSGNRLTLGVHYFDAETSEEAGRRFDAEMKASAGTLSYLGDLSGISYGVSIGMFSTELDSRGTDTNPNVQLVSEGDGYTIGLGVAQKYEKWSWFIHGAYVDFSTDSNRQNGQFSPKLATYDISSYSISFHIDYFWLNGDTHSLASYAEYGYQETTNDGFNESNSPDTVTINSFDEDISYGKLGIAYHYLGSETFTPYINLGVSQDMGDDGVVYTGSDSIGASFSSTVVDPLDTLFFLELGSLWNVSESFTIGLDLKYQSGGEFESLGWNLTGSYRF